MERASVCMPVLAIQFFMFFTEEGLAIQCYQCSNDDTSTFCNDPFNPNLDGLVTKCEGKSCAKVKYKERSGWQYVFRNCQNDVIEKSSCEDIDILGLTGVACACDKELCNDSRIFGSFSGLILILSIASLALLMKLQ